MPKIRVEEPLLEITLEGTDKNEFLSTVKDIEQVLKIIGAYKKRTPIEKLPAGTDEMGRKLFKYVVKFYIVTTGDLGKKATRILSEMRKNPQGYILRGKAYHLPEDIEVRIKVVPEVTEITSMKNLEKKIAMPKATAEEQLRQKSGLNRMTLIARSDKPKVLRKFVKKYKDEMEAKGCIISRIDFYKCHGTIRAYQFVEGYKFEAGFTVKPQTLVEAYVFLPSSPKGLEVAKKAIVIRELPLYEEYPEFKQMVAAVPEVEQYLGKVKDYQTLKKVAPDIASKLAETGLWGTFDKVTAYYHRYSNKADLLLRVVPERPGTTRRALVKVYIDGRPVNEGTPYKIPAVVRIWGVPAYDETGKPISHNLKVVTSKYTTSKEMEKDYYTAVIWSLANTNCYLYSKGLESKNPGKIKVVQGEYRELTDPNCEAMTS